MEKIDVTAMGELLIDFTENGISRQGNPVLEANPGGAPCNVLAMLQNLGDSTAFIGKVGRDMFGDRLKKTVQAIGIDTKGLVQDENIRTTLAFVHTHEDGDREFSFYRNPGADMMLTDEEINEEVIMNSRIFHFGTLSMTNETVRNATLKALEIAKQSGCIISFDPNIREPLWNDMEEARQQVYKGLSYCNVLKISDNEIQWLTGEADYSDGVLQIRNQFDIDMILVSMGNAGSRVYYYGNMVEANSFLQEGTIETTGAGDTFCGCILHYILKWGLKDITKSQLREMLTFANAAASIITTRKGALCVMPTEQEIKELLDSYF
ncbi:MAG: carbohydrate kinase [Lachnospiraceae bacterium]|nr:carbohydrate kinase [Lachnospiraceae bacterium]